MLSLHLMVMMLLHLMLKTIVMIVMVMILLHLMLKIIVMIVMVMTLCVW
jgi:hypothetical protein